MAKASSLILIPDIAVFQYQFLIGCPTHIYGRRMPGLPHCFVPLRTGLVSNAQVNRDAVSMLKPRIMQKRLAVDVLSIEFDTSIAFIDSTHLDVISLTYVVVCNSKIVCLFLDPISSVLHWLQKFNIFHCVQVCCLYVLIFDVSHYVHMGCLYVFIFGVFHSVHLCCRYVFIFDDFHCAHASCIYVFIFCFLPCSCLLSLCIYIPFFPACWCMLSLCCHL